MNWLFSNSKFNGDVSKWRPLRVENTMHIFSNCKAPVPYWFRDSNQQIIKKIESYDLFNKMNSELIDSNSNNKKIKI